MSLKKTLVALLVIVAVVVVGAPVGHAGGGGGLLCDPTLGPCPTDILTMIRVTMTNPGGVDILGARFELLPFETGLLIFVCCPARFEPQTVPIIIDLEFTPHDVTPSGVTNPEFGLDAADFVDTAFRDGYAAFSWTFDGFDGAGDSFSFLFDPDRIDRGGRDNSFGGMNVILTLAGRSPATIAFSDDPNPFAVDIVTGSADGIEVTLDSEVVAIFPAPGLPALGLLGIGGIGLGAAAWRGRRRK